MSRWAPVLNDIQRAEARRRRHELGEKYLSIALDLGVSEVTVRRACARPRQERHDPAAAADLALQAAALFGLTLEQLQQSPGRGKPETGACLHHARAAAVAAMRVGDRPIAWDVIAEVLAPGGGEHARLSLNKIWRRARATAPAPSPVDARKVG